MQCEYRNYLNKRIVVVLSEFFLLTWTMFKQKSRALLLTSYCLLRNGKKMLQSLLFYNTDMKCTRKFCFLLTVRSTKEQRDRF